MKSPIKLKTKDRIILMAIKLYNESGVQAVTSRHIAAEMKISHGNLDYHYKTKEDLLLAIYDKMRTEMSEYFITRKPNSTSIEHLHLLLIQLEEFQYKYRFINLDVLEITRAYPKISQLIQQTTEQRKEQMQALFQESLSEGYMFEIAVKDYEKLQHLLRIVITFWLSQREVLATKQFTEKGTMVSSIWAVMTPYLTEAGLDEKEKVIAKYGYIAQELTLN